MTETKLPRHTKLGTCPPSRNMFFQPGLNRIKSQRKKKPAAVNTGTTANETNLRPGQIQRYGANPARQRALPERKDLWDSGTCDPMPIFTQFFIIMKKTFFPELVEKSSRHIKNPLHPEVKTVATCRASPFWRISLPIQVRGEFWKSSD